MLLVKHFHCNSPHLPKNPCKSSVFQTPSFRYFWNQFSGSFHFRDRMTEARMEVVSAPRCVFEPKDVRLLSTKCLKHRSALLLSTGMPGCRRKVKYFSLFFRRAALILERGVGSRAWCSETESKSVLNFLFR